MNVSGLPCARGAHRTRHLPHASRSLADDRGAPDAGRLPERLHPERDRAHDADVARADRGLQGRQPPTDRRGLGLLGLRRLTRHGVDLERGQHQEHARGRTGPARELLPLGIRGLADLHDRRGEARLRECAALHRALRWAVCGLPQGSAGPSQGCARPHSRVDHGRGLRQHPGVLRAYARGTGGAARGAEGSGRCG